MSGAKACPASAAPLRAVPMQALSLTASFACILPGVALSCIVLAVYVVTAHGWTLLLAFAGEAAAHPAWVVAALSGAGLVLAALLVWWPRLLHGLVFAAGLGSTAINVMAVPATQGGGGNWTVIGLGLLGTFIAATAVRRTAHPA